MSRTPDQKIKKLCVFCGSSSGVDEIYKSAARNLGALCAAQNWTLVFGGGHVGLMGIMADAALAGGGEVEGVIPKFLQDKEVAHDGLSKLHVTETMHERQNMMAQLADAFVILPGGLGTLAEFFEVLTWKQLGLHDKPIIVVNAGGYWDSLQQMTDHMRRQGFIRADDKALFDIIENIAALEGFFQ